MGKLLYKGVSLDPEDDGVLIFGNLMQPTRERKSFLIEDEDGKITPVDPNTICVRIVGVWFDFDKLTDGEAFNKSDFNKDADFSYQLKTLGGMTSTGKNEKMSISMWTVFCNLLVATDDTVLVLLKLLKSKTKDRKG